MTYLIFSDLHGSLRGLAYLRAAVAREKPDVILCLGDILYGAYDGDTNACVDYLYSIRGKLLAVMGNCDYSYDAERLGVSLPKERELYIGSRRLYASHIHPYAGMREGDIVAFGHTHCKTLYQEQGMVFLNPGSIAKPRDGLESYAVIIGEDVFLKSAEDGACLEHLSL